MNLQALEYSKHFSLLVNRIDADSH